MPNIKWNQFLEEVNAAKEELGLKGNQECFYRGHTNKQHSLLPGLFRQHEKNMMEEDLLDIESDMFFEFRSRAKEAHNGSLSDWDILFYMQHHGLKTRLLDWTESLGVALYFALLNYKAGKNSPCIWMLNPYKLNGTYQDYEGMFDPESLDTEEQGMIRSYSDYISYEENSEEIWWDEPIALYPIRRVERLTKQGGYFTIHGKNNQPIEKIVPKEKKIWKQLLLPEETVPDAFNFLEHAGINDFTLFPDLDGLARYMTKKYF